MIFTAAVVGLGYWGPNLVRNLAAHPQFTVAGVCDQQVDRLERVGAVHPAARRYRSFSELLAAGPPDLVAIATPVGTHHQLAVQALEAGCHVLVEKPFTRTVAEAEEVLALARARSLRVFVDHTFLFTPAVAEIARQLREGFGRLLYVDSVRIALGLFQPDVDVLWDLAPHDVAILGHLIGRGPRSLRALGSSHNPRGMADVAFVHLDYGDGLEAHLHLSWLSPVKVRRMFFSGEHRSLIWDDLEPAERVKVYDHGVSFEVRDPVRRHEMLVSYRKGEMRAPALGVAEALATEVDELAAVLGGGREPTVPGEAGLEVVRVLAAADESLRRDGATVQVS